MNIKWLGTASLLVESDGHKILFDPYLRKFNKRLPQFPLEEIADTEAIFITHPHVDHYADMPEVFRYTHCPVYTNARGAEIAEKQGFDLSRINCINFGDGLKYGNLTIKACRGRHVIFDKACVKSVIKRALNGQVKSAVKLQRLNKRFSIDFKEDVFTFLLQEGNTTALILGSANRDEQEEYPPIDILIYPFQGRSDMLEYSPGLVKSFSPKTVILDHFDDAFPPFSTRMNAEEFKQKLESESAIKVIIPTENTPIIL